MTRTNCTFIPVVLVFLLLIGGWETLHSQELRLDVPDLVLDGVSFTLDVTVRDAAGNVDTAAAGTLVFEGVSIGEGGIREARLDRGRFRTKSAMVSGTGERRISVNYQAQILPFPAGGQPASAPLRRGRQLTANGQTRSIPGFLSILPPLLAIVLALLLRQVIVSLFAGVWLGAVFVFGYDPFGGFLRVLDHYIIGALADPDHISIIAFSMLFGGMVGVLSLIHI